MAANIESNIANGSAVEAYKAQIQALKSDPNATPAFKQQLDAWLGQMEAAAGAPNSTDRATPAPQPSPQPAGGMPPGAVAGDGPKPLKDTAAPSGASSGSEPNRNPTPPASPAGDVGAKRTAEISGSDKTIAMSNKSGKDMVLWHTGGDGGPTKKIATLKPGETIDLKVGNGTSGAFTKGDANGAFTTDSGRVEYSVTKDGKMSANLDSERGVDAMSLQAGQFSKQVGDVAAAAPASMKDASGRLLEPISHPEVEKYLSSLPDYNKNSYARFNDDTRTNVMEASMLDVDKISASF